MFDIMKVSSLTFFLQSSHYLGGYAKLNESFFAFFLFERKKVSSQKKVGSGRHKFLCLLFIKFALH